VVGRMTAFGLNGMSWSDSSKELLVLRAPGLLSTWVPGGKQSTAVRLPATPQGWNDCTLAPDDKYVVCSGYSHNQATLWALIRLADGAVLTEKSNDVPVDWAP
jgi:hypothetical protein